MVVGEESLDGPVWMTILIRNGPMNFLSLELISGRAEVTECVFGFDYDAVVVASSGDDC